MSNEWHPWASRDDLQQWMGGMGFTDTPEEFMQVQRDQQHAQQTKDDAQLVIDAQTVVENGEMTYSEAALALRNSGRQAAHDAFVQQWREEEAQERAEDAAFEVATLDAEGYAALVAGADVQHVGRLKQEVDQLLAGQIKERLDATVPAGHALRAGIEAAIIHQLSEGDAPGDAEGQNTLIRGAVQRADVIEVETESIRQQVDQEWRILRRTQGKSGPLMTAADIEAAKEHYISGRMQQLADARMIDHDTLKAPPTADEEEAKYVERFSKRNGLSTSLHEQVGGIEQRGRDAEAARRQGGTTYGSGSERDRYRESVRNAEANARVGGVATTENATQSRNPDHPELPPDWADVYGPAGYSA